jgi:predicted regulator of Ras-like GTPase activity (Roadblock/LC7/MglB family)
MILKSEKPPERAQVERLLAEIARETPQINWIALIKSRFVASFPSKPKVELDRISAMGAAMSALGERIASELEDGELQYILVAGTTGISVTIELDRECFLAIGLKKEVSIEEFLSQMQKTHLPPLLKILHMENNRQLSGVQQE